MRTEARRKYHSGFALTEQELRRIHDVADQQMKRALTDTAYDTAYEVRYRSGAIAEPKTLDDVFSQENWGSAAIRLVSVTFREKSDRPTTKINVTFADSAAMEIAKGSMAYGVEGQDRDWVFVASSQLSERLSRVERINVPRILNHSMANFVLLTFLLMGMLGALLFVRDPTTSEATTSIRQLREAWKKGEIRDPVDTILRIEEARLTRMEKVSLAFLIKPLLIPFIVVPLLLFGLPPILNYFFPPFNFLWGEYQREYETKKGRLRFIIVGVVLTIVLGIAVNVLTKKLGW